MKKLIQIGRLLFIGAIIGFNVAKAQGTGDSIVQITADAQGLSLISPDQLPPIGTYWMITPGGGPNGCVQAPLPIPPSGGLPVYQVADGEFIVDGTVGETVNETMLEAQANAIVNLINQIQGTQGIGMRAMDDSDPLFPGGSGGSYGYPTNSYVFSINTNLLWLQITNVSGGLAYLNLGSATDSVYGVYATPDLTQPFTNWLPVTELWPTNQTTNIYPFSVNADMATNQFYRALDWGNANGGYYLVNGLPAWWMYQWFGNLDETAGELDYANNLLPLGYDYTNGIVPEVVRFSVLFPDQAAQASPVSGQVGLWEGLPVAMAVLVNDTNTADAVWQPYATNIVVNLTAGNGLYTVLVGLRGFAARTAVWQQSVLTLNTAPPVLTVTNPVANLVSQPMIQIQGYANKGLSQLNYAVSNAAGIFSGQGLVTGQFYDTNLLACSTNYFQCFDVPLTNGLNLVTLQALDLAGNVTTNQFNYTLDYSGDTTPPGLAVVWPTNGAYVSATNFTVQAAIDDDTATVVASITDGYGGSNTVAGVVERDGTVWVQNLPLNTGANSLTLTATDAAGNVSTTNLTINQSGVQVTVAALPPDQLGLYSVTVTGTVSDPTARVYVNGVPAVVNDDGTWEADGVPVAAAGTALLDVLVYPAQVSSGGGGGGGASVVRSAISFSYDTNNLPTDTNSLGENVAALFQPPAVVTVEYHKRQTSAGLDADPPDYWFYSIGTSTVDWQDGVGGLAVAAGEETYYEYWPYSPYAYTSPYGGTETLLPVADYPMERGFVPGGTVDAQTALKTGGQSQLGRQDLYWVKVQLQDGGGNVIPPGQITMTPPQALTPSATDTNWSQLWVTAPGQTTVLMTPQTTAASYYSASFQVTDCGCANVTKDDWQQQVRDEIYFDTSGAADMNTYNPANGFMYNRTNLQAVYAFYQKLFNENTNLYWAGLGKLAGAPVYAGLSDAEYSKSYSSLMYALGLLGIGTNDLTAFQNTLITMNTNILQDLAWQSEAYAKDGLCALEEVYANEPNALDLDTITAWRGIDQGIQQTNASMVQAGNLQLAHREQFTILQPIYNTLSGAVTNLMSALAQNPVPTGTSFATVVPGGQLSIFADRWNWITNSTGGIWPSWTAASPIDRSTWVNIPLTTRASTYATYPLIY